MSNNQKDLSFTGERFLPGMSGRRIEQDHYQRYNFASQFCKEKSVLDFACGSGYGSTILTQGGACSYTGKDISPESVEHANRKYGAENISFSVGNICEFDEIDKYDLITCFETIEHVTCYKNALNNLYSSLKPGGMLLVSSPNRPVTSPKANNLSDKPANTFHTQEFIPSELIEELCNVGFNVDKNGIFGQRQRMFYNNPVVFALIRATKFPDIFAYITSPNVTPVTNKTPRYFLLVANK